MSKKKKYRRMGNFYLIPQAPPIPTIFEPCDMCGSDIKYGNACLEVSRLVVQVDRDFITVIDSDPLMTVCASCGNKLGDEKIRKHLQELLHLDGMSLGHACNPKVDEFDWRTSNKLVFSTCDRCNKEIKIGNACVNVDWCIEQVDWDNDRNDSVITIIYAQDVLMLCAHCGNRFGTRKVQDHLRLLLSEE